MNLAKILIIMTTMLFIPFADAADTPEWGAVAAAYGQSQAKGDFDTIEKALELANSYAEKYPKDGRAMTYRGSLAAMKARESILPWRKLGSLNQGVDWMDEGVALILKDKELAGGRIEIEVRMVRGITSARIPTLFGRGSVARADFLTVIANSHFSEINNVNKASAYAWLAVLSRRQGASPDDYLSKARAIDPVTANAIWERFKQ